MATIISGDSGGTAVTTTTQKVLQVVSLTSDTVFTTTSTALVDTGIGLSITPTLSTSKVLVMVTASIGSGANGYPAFGIMRGATSIGVGTTVSSRTGVSGGAYTGQGVSVITVATNHLDSPATTSATEYSITLKAGNGGTAIINRTSSDTNANYVVRPISTITLMEIGV